MTRAALYARASSEGQVASSIPGQLDACREYAKQHSMTVVHEFKDEGISAYKDVDRPAFEAMRRAAEAGEFDVLVVWNTDRLSRKTGSKGTLALKWDLEEHGVTIASVSQANTEDPFASELLALVEGFRAHSESANKSKAVRRGISQRRSNGLYAGRRPYGYSPDGSGGMAPDDRAAVVRGIFDAWIAGETQSDIARRLERDGVPTDRGGRWEQATVGQMLRNKTYCGYIKDHDAADGWSPGSHEAIVTLEVYEQAQRRMLPKGAKRGGRASSNHLLAGLLFCGECGERMRVRKGVERKAGRYETYTCPNHNGKYDSTCPMPPIPRFRLDQAVRQHFADNVLDVERSREAFMNARDSELVRLRGEQSLLDRESDRATAAFNNARDLMAAGTFLAEDLAVFRDRRDAAVDAALKGSERLAAVEQARPPADIEAAIGDALRALVDGLEGDHGTAALRGQLKAIFDRFVVYPFVSSTDLDDHPDDEGDPAELVVVDDGGPRGQGGWTIFPELRPETIVELEVSWRPSAAVLELPANAQESGCDIVGQKDNNGFAKNFIWPAIPVRS